MLAMLELCVGAGVGTGVGAGVGACVEAGVGADVDGVGAGVGAGVDGVDGVRLPEFYYVYSCQSSAELPATLLLSSHHCVIVLTLSCWPLI